MDHVRRPTNTPTLGVPDFGWLAARAQAAVALIGNTKWVTVAPVALTVAPGVTIASIPMTALATGRFRARLTGYISNTSGALHVITPAIGHGVTLDYTQAFLNVPAGTGEAVDTATVALIVDLPANGFTAVVGSTTNIIANLTADANGVMLLLAHAMQFEVQEY